MKNATVTKYVDEECDDVCYVLMCVYETEALKTEIKL